MAHDQVNEPVAVPAGPPVTPQQRVKGPYCHPEVNPCVGIMSDCQTDAAHCLDWIISLLSSHSFEQALYQCLPILYSNGQTSPDDSKRVHNVAKIKTV